MKVILIDDWFLEETLEWAILKEKIQFNLLQLQIRETEEEIARLKREIGNRIHPSHGRFLGNIHWGVLQPDGTHEYRPLESLSIEHLENILVTEKHIDINVSRTVIEILKAKIIAKYDQY